MKDILRCLKGVHQSQSLYLLKILAECFLSSSHQSVARMAERLICKKLEMYAAGQKVVKNPTYSFKFSFFSVIFFLVAVAYFFAESNVSSSSFI